MRKGAAEEGRLPEVGGRVVHAGGAPRRASFVNEKTLSREGGKCITMSYMKSSAVTIRLDPDLEALLDRVCAATGRSRSEVVREALRRQLSLELFDEARRKVLPFAEASGILTDEDVFDIVS